MDTNASLHIAVIGTGNIGSSLGNAFSRAGHTVTYGARSPEKGLAAGESAAITDFGAAVAAADIVVLAIPGNAVAAFAAENHAGLAGKLIVDAANSVGGGGPAHHFAELAAAVPTARYARAFNTLGWENFADPTFGDTVGDLFFSSAETDRAIVEQLVGAVGLRPMYVGEGQQDAVDGVLRLWFALVVGQKHGRRLAFRTLEG